MADNFDGANPGKLECPMKQSHCSPSWPKNSLAPLHALARQLSHA